MRKKLKLIITLILTLSSSLFFAQNHEISGTITTETGIPLEFATILVKGSKTSTTSDALGKFKISSAVNNPTLIVSLFGYQTREIVAKDHFVDIQLVLENNSLDEIVVVGSRNPKKSKLETAVPVDVVNLAKIRNTTPQTTTNDILTYLIPSFNSNRQSSADGTEHIDPASLRGLGPDQVLVLINGKRRHTTSLVNYQNTVGNGSVGTDLSAIPASAIKRIEVLRDGAAAQYGSDAIAGVINLVLKDNAGLEANATYGSTSRDDGQTTNLNLNYGTKIGNKGGFINFTGEFNDRQKTNRSQNHNLIIFDQSAQGNFFAYEYADDPAQSRQIDDNLLAKNGLKRDDFNFQIGDAKIQNIQGFFNASIPLNDQIEFYASGGVSHRKGTGYGFRRLPSETESVVASIFPFGFQPELNSVVTDLSSSFGFKFKFGEWKLDLSNTIGENKFVYDVSNTNNFSLGDASPTEFKAGNHSFLQNTVNADISRLYKDIFSGLNVAFGAEYRYEKYKIVPGEEASYINGGAQSFPGFSPLNEVNEDRNSVGVYADVEADITDKFLVGIAGRYEDYTDFGNTINGKLSLRYKILDNLFVRGAISSGFRAPSLHQQYFNNIATDVVDGELLNSGIFRNDSDVAKQLGIPKLKEETSRNYSFGVVFSPTKQLHITADYYHIRIDNRIILTGNLGNDAYGEPVPELRNLFAQYGAQTGRFFTNAINTTTNGIDVVIDYDLNAGRGKLNLSLLYNYNNNQVDNQLNNIPSIFIGQEDVYYGPQERSLIESNTPKHKGTFAVNYNIDKWNFLLRNTYFGEVVRDGFPFGGIQRHNGKVVTDLTIAYKITPKLQFALGANNLFDVFPDKQIYENSYFGVFKYAPVQMGTTGAYYFGRMSFSL
ncbi:TonB-dependent receptor [Flavobacterium sp. WLB]|uniref:TonB-dependent receptor n=1 Tax=unclassified Flavobacterium TaxID=196869 RepID=UPI0006ABC39C|nr:MULTISPECIES: TonB-dependent receptor [unclassified Flavobacterium]KOP37107.1 ferric enterobactin receptor [Flavobacterium sp. VMW]OWU89472.1 ferric enterobactin receptor [Flavobacterium sp. NLM]PUU69131.1 TonB-dependent receptor [Flavobacterium sp. WLB]